MFLRFRCLDLNTRHNHSTSLRFCFQGCLQRHLDFRAADIDRLDFLFWFHPTHSIICRTSVSSYSIGWLLHICKTRMRSSDSESDIIRIIIITAGSGINWMAWYLPNTDLKPFLLLNIQFAQGFQKALSGFLVPLRFPWASKSTCSAAKTESLKPRSQFYILCPRICRFWGTHTCKQVLLP